MLLSACPTLAQDSPRREAGSVLHAPQAVGRIWPDGCYGFAVKPAGNRESYKREEFLQEVYSLQRLGVLKPLLNGREVVDGAIGLANVRNSHRRQSPPRGSKGMTRYGSRMVSSACRILQGRFGKGKLGFLTMTPPTLSAEDWGVWAREWGAVCRVFQQWLKRELVRLRLSPMVVSVTELQARRSAREGGIPAYHLHLVMQAGIRDYSGLLSPLKIRLAWKRAWESRLTGKYDWSKCEELRYVKKDAGAYLSKYLTKGSACAESMMASGWAVPSTWWNMTAEMRIEVKRQTLTSEAAMSMVEWLTYKASMGNSWARELVAMYGYIDIQDDCGYAFRVGAYGRLSARGIAYIRKAMNMTSKPS